MQQLTCRFASYIKHKERGKKGRRAIASATMLLRPFLHIIESFHLALSKDLPGSTISIGGEEKKAKITCNMEITALDTELATHVSQGTEEATKWNECISPAIFYLMHHYFFSNNSRMALNIPRASKYGKIFENIAKIGYLFQAWKEIQLGPGPIVQSEKHYSRLEWIDEHVKYMNTNIAEWYLRLRHGISEDRRYVRSSPGMMMGMLNAASTTIGLLPAKYRMKKNTIKVVCMRSSDDSTTKYLSTNAADNVACVIQNKLNLSLIGINLSPDKTFLLPEGIAENISWYIDRKFVSQYGTEVPSIRPQLKSHETRSSDDDEPLINLTEDEDESFHAFLPTPNYATIKSSRPRQKALNYKGQRIVKDLFKTEEKKNEMTQATSKKKGKSTIKRDQKKKTKNKNDSVKRLKRTVQQENSKRSKIEMKKSAEGGEKEWYCHACGENRMEDMRQCPECQKWYHEECMGLTKNELKFICSDCD